MPWTETIKATSTHLVNHEVLCFAHKYIAPGTGDGVRNMKCTGKSPNPLYLRAGDAIHPVL